MASKKNKSVSIKQYKNKREMNLGIFLFAIVFLYLIITVISYFANDTVSVYEVRKGSIVRDTSYTGLVIRNESVINAEQDGYVSFYQNENSKVKKGAKVYALTASELDVDESDAGDDEAELRDEVQSGIVRQIQDFNESYRESDFSAVYLLKNEISISLQNELSQSKTEHLDAVLEESKMEAETYTADRDGIIAYTIDGYENLTKDTFSDDDFDRSGYESTIIEDKMRVATGSPVYKMITGESWSVIVPLDEETANELMEKEISSIKARIDKDSETVTASFSVMERDGKYYGCLDLSNSMIRYAEDRYLNVELILEDQSGLKIPKTAVVQEEFYLIPEDYLTYGGNSSSRGVMIKEGDDKDNFEPLDIYNITEDGYACISKKDLKEGDILIKPEAADTYYSVRDSITLDGVYNINKGYSVFRKVTILCENDEYCIVREGEDYGLSNYDHIVQNGESVEPEEVVY